MRRRPARNAARSSGDGRSADDYIVPKRRYSAFFGADLEILLKGLKAETLILVGGLTDVCVHYTFVDGHQHDYFVRVAEDCVAGSSEAAREASLNAMEYLQTGARRTSAEIIAALGAGADRA
ncbi:MAG: cysteine hydrolase [Pseudomonadota bacterium]